MPASPLQSLPPSPAYTVTTLEDGTPVYRLHPAAGTAMRVHEAGHETTVLHLLPGTGARPSRPPRTARIGMIAALMCAYGAAYAAAWYLVQGIA